MEDSEREKYNVCGVGHLDACVKKKKGHSTRRQSSIPSATNALLPVQLSPIIMNQKHWSMNRAPFKRRTLPVMRINHFYLEYPDFEREKKTPVTVANHQLQEVTMEFETQHDRHK